MEPPKKAHVAESTRTSLHYLNRETTFSSFPEPDMTMGPESLSQFKERLILLRKVPWRTSSFSPGCNCSLKSSCVRFFQHFPLNLSSNILSSVADVTPKSAMMSLIIGLKSRACVLIYGENIIRRGHDIHLHNGDGEDLAGVSKVFSIDAIVNLRRNNFSMVA